MAYTKEHTDNECDRCLKDVGRGNLKSLPFIYCDKNDNMHEDVSHLIGKPNEGYRQYYVCEDCYNVQTKS